MEGRRSRPRRKKTPSFHARYLKVLQQDRKCITDTEDVPEDVGCRRYSSTVFPLFSNYSLDEELMSKPPEVLPKSSEVTRKPNKEKATQAVNTVTEENSAISPISVLTVDCLLNIFSYLSAVEKGKCMRVCKDWNNLLLTASLWRSIKLWDFPLTCLASVDHRNDDKCYNCYKERVNRFSDFLCQLNPKLKKLEFKFDIGFHSDGFASLLENLAVSLDLSELQYLELNWKDTPVRPFWLLYNGNASCSDIIYHQRLRERYFTYLFDKLTSQATGIQVLVLPFSWNERSVSCLTRLKSLHTLVLEKYFVFKTLAQDLLDSLLEGLPNLQKLMLEIWCPCGMSMMPEYHFASKSLVYLDISQSRGFYLKSVDLPKLQRLQISRPVWNGPMTFRVDTKFPCLYKILVAGAPSLVKINEHYLKPEWRVHCYSTLDEVLKSICSCLRHKTGWLM